MTNIVMARFGNRQDTHLDQSDGTRSEHSMNKGHHKNMGTATNEPRQEQICNRLQRPAMVLSNNSYRSIIIILCRRDSIIGDNRRQEANADYIIIMIPARHPTIDDISRMGDGKKWIR